jgi:DNA polymerase III delta prime subunit
MTRTSVAGIRLVIINDAENLTLEAQNALLKTIEEPAESTLIILTVEGTQGLLPTVLSRCEAVYFAPVTAAVLARELVTSYRVRQDTADLVAGYAEAIPGRAIALMQDEHQMEAYRKIQVACDRIQQASLFERLVISEQVQKEGMSPKLLLTALGVRLRQKLRNQASTTTADQLDALEQFERYLGSNVNLKSALGYLMLQL